MQPVALYVGSFDPVTNGHIDVVRHAAKLASRLVIAVGVHPGKIPLFSAEERLAMIHDERLRRGPRSMAVSRGPMGAGHCADKLRTTETLIGIAFCRSELHTV